MGGLWRLQGVTERYRRRQEVLKGRVKIVGGVGDFKSMLEDIIELQGGKNFEEAVGGYLIM
jgi:hypothetical protein